MIVIGKFLSFRPESEAEDEFVFNQENLMADVIDEIIRQVQALQTGNNTGVLKIHYDGFAFNPPGKFRNYYQFKRT